jgi:SAM-dependent methyltransferase
VKGVVSDVAAIPFASEVFDIVAMRSVSEHLPDPVAAFREIARVLKPGGALAILCPNKWYYASMAGRLIPGAAAGGILKLIFGKSVYDNFPTYYRANTRRAVRRLARQSGLDVEVAVPCEHPPDYLKLSPTLFHAGVLWDRITARWRPLQGLAVSYLFVLRKPGAGQGTHAA